MNCLSDILKGFFINYFVNCHRQKSVGTYFAAAVAVLMFCVNQLTAHQLIH